MNEPTARADKSTDAIVSTNTAGLHLVLIIDGDQHAVSLSDSDCAAIAAGARRHEVKTSLKALGIPLVEQPSVDEQQIGNQLLTIEPMYPNPSCLWRRDEKREAIIFHRDRQGEEVLRLIGNSSRIDHLARLLAAAQRNAAAFPTTWSSDPPNRQGWYWHWNGDEDCAPLPTSVLYSGTTRKCFVSRGQLCLESAIDCDQYGGLWMPMREPPTRGADGLPIIGSEG